jgi:LuxR family maltose regulon positive regulatory protein
LDGSLRVHPVWIVAAALLEAIAHDTLGDPGAAGRALERALDVAEPDLTLFPFLVHPAPGLLELHARNCAKHATLISEILSLPGGYGGAGSPPISRGGLGGSSPRG